jgi:hypothetical protein
MKGNPGVAGFQFWKEYLQVRQHGCPERLNLMLIFYILRFVTILKSREHCRSFKALVQG